MAFYNEEDNEQEQQQNPEAQQAALGAPVTTGGPSSVITGQGSGSAAGAQATSAANTPDNPGNFVGIKQYLDANKNQAEKFGQDVKTKFDTQTSQTEEQIGQLGGSFQQLANQGTISNLATAGQDAQTIAQNTANASKAALQAQKAADQARFAEVANAQYKGPKELIETDLWQPTYKGVQKAQSYFVGEKGEELKGEGQKTQILNSLYGSPSYTSGQNKLDTYLLNSDENVSRIQDSLNKAGALSGQFDSQTASAKEYAGQLKAQTEAARTQARSSLETSRAARTKAITKELDKQSKNWREDYNKYLNLLRNSGQGTNLDLTPAEAQRLGVSEGQRIFNLLKGVTADTTEEDLKKLINLQTFDANKVISADQQAQLAALDQLAALYGGTQTNKFNAADQAGTLTRDSALDTSGIKSQVGNLNSGFKTDSRNKVNATASGDKGLANGEGSYSGSMQDYLTGNYKMLPPVTKEDWKDIDRMFFGSYGGGGMAKSMMQIDLDRKAANYNAQQQWIAQMKKQLAAAGYDNKVKQ